MFNPFAAMGAALKASEGAVEKHLQQGALLAQKAPAPQENAEEMREVYLLSLGGGGIRGLIACEVLIALEKMGVTIAKHFKIIAGTSVGGIEALALNVPLPQDAKIPRYTATDIKGLFVTHGESIFATNCFNIFALFGPHHEASVLEDVLLKYFGDYELRNAVGHVAVTTVSNEAWRPRTFDSYLAKKEKTAASHNFKMWRLARATSAAPTFFAQMPLDGSELVDGGLVQNYPVSLLFDTAKLHHPGKPLRMLSIGTGFFDRTVGLPSGAFYSLKWAKVIADATMTPHKFLDRDRMVGELGENFFELEPVFDREVAMNDASSSAIEFLEHTGQELVEKNHEKLESWARRMTL